MVLATPGLNVNGVMDNDCNAAFAAVKHGDIKTLELLIDAGINVKQRIFMGGPLCTTSWRILDQIFFDECSSSYRQPKRA
mmetsp:Transcript_22402/g.33310  ORF Transcript_22402/g.33310 Transcript_22402/m.33310 type:complete len:80 (+) Transcript_22402:93-332(+)